MKTLLAIICAAFLMVFLNANAAISQACFLKTNPKNCASEDVCTWVNFEFLPHTAKELNKFKRKFISEALRRDLSCVSSPLRSAYNQLSIEERKLVQTNLKTLSFYNSDIDGLYGKKTSEALKKFNMSRSLQIDLSDKRAATYFLNEIVSSQEAKIQSQAQACGVKHPNRCSDKELCLKSTRDGKWITSGLKAAFTKEAIDRKLDCKLDFSVTNSSDADLKNETDLTLPWYCTDQTDRYFSSLTNVQISAAQKKLLEAGQDPGPIDGIRGSSTTRAILNWQLDKGLKGTGFLSRSQFFQLLGGSKSADTDCNAKQTLQTIQTGESNSQSSTQLTSLENVSETELIVDHSRNYDFDPYDCSFQMSIKNGSWEQQVIFYYQPDRLKYVANIGVSIAEFMELEKSMLSFASSDDSYCAPNVTVDQNFILSGEGSIVFPNVKLASNKPTDILKFEAEKETSLPVSKNASLFDILTDKQPQENSSKSSSASVPFENRIEELEKELARALAELAASETKSDDLQVQLKSAIAAKLASEALSDKRLDELVEKEILRQEALKKLKESEVALTKSEEEALKLQKQTTALNGQVAELRKQLGQLQALLEESEAADRDNKVQLQNLGNRLNAALAKAAAEERRRRKLEEEERIVLNEENTDLSKTIVMQQIQLEQLQMLLDQSGSEDIENKKQIQNLSEELTSTLAELATSERLRRKLEDDNQKLVDNNSSNTEILSLIQILISERLTE